MLTKNVLHIFRKILFTNIKYQIIYFFLYIKIRSNGYFIGRIHVIGIIELIFYAYLKISLN